MHPVGVDIFRAGKEGISRYDSNDVHGDVLQRLGRKIPKRVRYHHQQDKEYRYWLQKGLYFAADPRRQGYATQSTYRPQCADDGVAVYEDEDQQDGKVYDAAGEGQEDGYPRDAVGHRV